MCPFFPHSVLAGIYNLKRKRARVVSLHIVTVFHPCLQQLQSWRSSWKRSNLHQEHPNLYSFVVPPQRSFPAQMVIICWCSRNSCLWRRGNARAYKEKLGLTCKEINQLSNQEGLTLEDLHWWLKPSFGHSKWQHQQLILRSTSLTSRK